LSSRSDENESGHMSENVQKNIERKEEKVDLARQEDMTMSQEIHVNLTAVKNTQKSTIGIDHDRESAATKTVENTNTTMDEAIEDIKNYSYPSHSFTTYKVTIEANQVKLNQKIKP
jgi:hypothetical protein